MPAQDDAGNGLLHKTVESGALSWLASMPLAGRPGNASTGPSSPCRGEWSRPAGHLVRKLIFHPPLDPRHPAAAHAPARLMAGDRRGLAQPELAGEAPKSFRTGSAGGAACPTPLMSGD